MGIGPLVELVVGRVAEGSAAASAGLLAGDRIVAAGGDPITSARALIERVRASGM